MSVRRIACTLAVLWAAGAAQATTLTVASFPNFDEAIKMAIPLYKKRHPEIDIKLTSLAYGDHHNAMSVALATGSNLPDVMGVEFGYVGRFAESGGLEDLSKPPYNALQYRSQFVKYTFPQAMGPAGNLAAMPADIGPGALFYRKDLMDKAGVTEADLTRSWDSFLASGKKLKAATGSYLLGNARDLMEIYIRANLKDGEGVFFDQNNKVLVDSPRFVKAFELAKAARDAKLDAKVAAWSNEWAESFKRGTVATESMGAWLAGQLESWLAPNTKGLWRSALLPNGAYASYGGSFYAIPKKAEHKQEAWEFIRFLTSDREVQLAALKNPSLKAFPALLEAQNDAFFEEPVDFLGGQKARLLWRDAAHHVPVIDVNKYDAVAREIVQSELDRVLTQGKDIKTALADAKSLIEQRARR